MNIELKNIKYYESFSEETLAFLASLYTSKANVRELPKTMTEEVQLTTWAAIKRDKNSYAKQRIIPKLTLINTILKMNTWRHFIPMNFEHKWFRPIIYKKPKAVVKWFEKNLIEP